MAKKFNSDSSNTVLGAILGNAIEEEPKEQQPQQEEEQQTSPQLTTTKKDAIARLKTIKELGEKRTFTFKSSSELLNDINFMATIEKRTAREIVEDAIIAYFKDHAEDYIKVLEMKKLFNL